MQYKIGIDIGTTSTKAVLYDERNNILAVANEGYPTLRPAPDQSEQDPKAIFAACKQAIKQLTAQIEENSKVQFLSFSSAMHAFMAVDKNGEPLTNMWLWSDNRAQRQIEKFKQTDWHSFYQKTGTPIHPMSPFAKLLWLREESAIFQMAHKFIGIKEYLFYQMTGKYVVDYSIASATGLFNIHQLEWDPEILTYLNLDPGKLSEAVEVTTAYSFADNELAWELGLTENTQLIIGASDGCLANLGTGANEKGDVALTIGTSGALRMTLEKPYLDPQGRTFCYYLSPDRWVVGGAVNNGGNVMEWLNTILYEEHNRIYPEIPKALMATLPGAQGLLFIPYLNGERAPLWDGSARGTFHGLSAYHNKQHLIRATLEGILYNLKEVLNILEEIGGKTIAIKASGGFLSSVEWTQMATDILGYPLAISQSQESSSLGAILLVDHDERKAHEEKIYHPQSDYRADYSVAFNQYIRYRDAIREIL